MEGTQKGGKEREQAVPEDGKKTRAGVARAQTTKTTERRKGVMGSTRGGPAGRPVKALRAATERGGSTTAAMPSRGWERRMRGPRNQPEKQQPTEPEKEQPEYIRVDRCKARHQQDLAGGQKGGESRQVSGRLHGTT